MTVFKESAGPARVGGIAVFAALMTALTCQNPVSARLAEAILGFDGSAGQVLPAKLSQTGLYANIQLKTRAVTEGIVPFEVNSALWSDGSFKERFITVPAGTVIVPTDSDKYVFPDKTVMIKNFAIDTIAGDANSRILIETRFMVIRKNATGHDFRGISYAWNRNQSDADLVSQENGLNLVIPIKAGGAAGGKRWRYPSRFDCRLCHLGRGSLGFITPQLNRPSKANPSVNQLADFFAKGILSRNPAASPTAMKWSALDDPKATLEAKGRSYLASNCSHCHGNGNKDVLGLPHDFDWLNPNMKFMTDPNDPFVPGPYMGQPARTFSSDFPMLMRPGHPDSSLVIKRMLTRGTFEINVQYEQMPWLATYQPDSAAVRVMSDWICAVGGKPAGAACKLPEVEQQPQPDPAGIPFRGHGGFAGRFSRARAVLRNGILEIGVSGKAAERAEAPILRGIQGKSVALKPIGAGRYAVAGELPPGAYILSWRGESITIIAEM
jgi:hypothetical protein